MIPPPSQRTDADDRSPPEATPLVFVVDDDVSVRESLEAIDAERRLARRDVRVGRGLSRPATSVRTKLPGARRRSSAPQRPRSADASRRPERHADHLH